MIAAITAGGRVEGELAAAFGTTVKALAPFADTTLLDIALASLRASGPTRIVVIGGDAVRAHCGARVDAVIDESPEAADNIRRALACGDPTETLLLAASDMPFVRAADVASFLDAARACDVALPLAGAPAYERAFPGAPNHTTRLGGECFANGSIVFFGAGVAPRAVALAERLFLARKSLWRMAGLLGPALLARFATRTLRIAHIEARGQALFGGDVRAIRDAAPELCFDIDTLDDYRYARAR